MDTCTQTETGGLVFSNFTGLSNKIIKCLDNNITNHSGIDWETGDKIDLISRHKFILVCSLLTVGCLCFMVSSVLLYIKLNSTKNKTNRILFTKPNVGPTTAENDWDIFGEIVEKLIPISKITRNHVIGRGEFGNVYFGQVLSNATSLVQLFSGELDRNEVDVAIKIPNEFSENINAALNEVQILYSIGHHLNIVGFYGFSRGNLSRNEIYILTEFCENGSLLQYLRTLGQEVTKENVKINKELITLLRFAHEISLGMEYLTAQQIIHGDLASRNVFIDAAFICKIGDFGLSIKDGLDNNLSCSKIPWKWRALECLESKILTLKSDVWSYGVTIWEIFSLGIVPYPGISYSELVTFLKNDNRLEKPRYASNEIYEVMLKCWTLLPNERPLFATIENDFIQIRKAYNVVIEQR